MGEETESVEAPNWLRELEAKREQRLKAKLGHEAGAGAPCLTCEEKCPGVCVFVWVLAVFVQLFCFGCRT